MEQAASSPRAAWTGKLGTKDIVLCSDPSTHRINLSLETECYLSLPSHNALWPLLSGGTVLWHLALNRIVISLSSELPIKDTLKYEACGPKTWFQSNYNTHVYMCLSLCVCTWRLEINLKCHSLCANSLFLVCVILICLRQSLPATAA
jgi:hypothetical protein